MGEEKAIKKYTMSVMQLTIITGFVGGFGGAFVGYLAHYFNFTEINPDVILTVFQGDWKKGWLGVVVAAILYGLLSIVVALIYYAMFRKRQSLLWGGLYGIVICALLFLVIHPLLPNIDSFLTYDAVTIMTEICFFLLYGIFIGYSISYEYNDQLQWEEQV